MRILIFHGYLLEGTGSNVYNARLAAALVGLGHEVHLLCQDRHPERQPFVDAAGDWDGGELRIRALRSDEAPSGGRCTVYRPDIGDLLPVYVADRYEAIEARTFARCSAAEIERYLDANIAAVCEVAERTKPDVALANHLVMGPVILARALKSVPYAVKVHGSALEYTVKADPERFLAFAREGLAGARTVLVGSAHTARSLWATLEDPQLPQRTRLGPPGVDVHRFRPLPAEELADAPARAARTVAARLHGSAASSPVAAESAFSRDELAAAQALDRLAALAASGPVRPVVFVGKLIVSKGVDLLLAAWPLVLERVPAATLLVIGFGAYRDALEQLAQALAAGDLEEANEIARAGRTLEAADEGAVEGATDRSPASAEPKPLHHLLAFLTGLDGERRARYLQAARALPERAIFTGRLDHEELADLLPACEALVVPSTFPEAFGMVAAEGAACGALPVSAAHSGLAEVSYALARAVPSEAARRLSFAVDDRAVVALAECVTGWLLIDPDVREQARAGLVATVRERWSWEGVARGVIAAAQGRLEELPGIDHSARAVG
ncbi:MAG TPA: glycosyltransferase family 4 protein [Solirubrobacteraceae bacterium]|jgi:glycosyltransferase involved in cell wall biosynthesis